MANVTTNSAVAIILLGGQGIQSIDVETDDVDYVHYWDYCMHDNAL